MTLRNRLARRLRKVADHLDPPEVHVIGRARADAAPGETVSVALSQPEPTLDLTEESGEKRSSAALSLMDDTLEGWLLVTLNDKGENQGAISIHGFIPTYAHEAYAYMLNMVKDTLEH